jgi:2,6-dihydroxypyridine 3-monooxygenase
VERLVDDAGRTYLVCACGNDHDADLIIWADGRKSTGRALLAPERPLTYNGYVVWRGLVDTPTPAPKGFQRYYDIPGGRLFSVTAPVEPVGRSYFEFSHNLHGHQWQELTGKRPEEHAYMLPGFVKRHPQVHDTIRRNAVGLPHRFEEIIDHAEISGIPVNDVDFPKQVVYHHTSGATSVLVGDAAIPVRLQVGAGLNQGIQQAYDMVDVLTAGRAALDTWEEAHMCELARWVELGRSRAHRNNLGWYLPVRRGQTVAPDVDQWTKPKWVIA